MKPLGNTVVAGALFGLVAVTMAYAIFTYQQVQASKQMIGEAKE